RAGVGVSVADGSSATAVDNSVECGEGDGGTSSSPARQPAAVGASATSITISERPIPLQRPGAPGGSAPGGLPLGELRRLAGALEAGLLAFLHARVTREEVLAALEFWLDRRVRGDEGAGDPHLDRARPAADAAAFAFDLGAEAALAADPDQGREHLGTVHVAREHLFDGAAVN